MKYKTLYFLLFLLLLGLVWVPTAHAQDEPALQLSLRRDFGFGAGGSIQGTFSFRVSGPDDLEEVTFLIDGEAIGRDAEAPFRLQFQTGDYALGVHTMSAVGVTGDGQELRSNTIQRQFVSQSESNRFLIWVVIPLVVLAIGGRALVTWLANRDSEKRAKLGVGGPLGGTICPNCERPYAIHLWSFNLVTFRIDRCPHCGAWRRVRRVAREALRAAQEEGETAVSPPPDTPEEGEDDLRRRLDDSRFDE